MFCVVVECASCHLISAAGSRAQLIIQSSNQRQEGINSNYTQATRSLAPDDKR